MAASGLQAILQKESTPTVDDHTNLDEANHQLAQEEERYRDEVNQGRHGAHKPCEKFPIEEARGQGAVAESC
jgi:hypothetical protein